jgi:hypothetical protein
MPTKIQGENGIKWPGPSEGRLAMANEEVITQKEDEGVEEEEKEDADMGQKGIAAAGAGR